jgi:hypothetical protein
METTPGPGCSGTSRHPGVDQTRSVFDRYAITDQGDIDAAVRKLESGRRQFPLTTPDSPPVAVGEMPRHTEVADLVAAAASGNLPNLLASQLERWITFLRQEAETPKKGVRRRSGARQGRKEGRLSPKGGRGKSARAIRRGCR